MNTGNNSNFFKYGKFFILGEFDETIGSVILPELIQEIERKKSEINPEDIKFIINSSGGYVFELLPLLVQINEAKKYNIDIETTIVGCAYSCASLLAVSGTKGKRRIGRFCEHLAHQEVFTGSSSTKVQAERQMKRMDRIRNKTYEIYKENMNKDSYDKLKKEMNDDDFFISAEECIDMGLADIII